MLRVPYVGGATLSTSHLGRFLVFTYIWLPFMVLPIQAALERVPPNLVQASMDLGARRGQTFRHVIWPLAFPGVVAGSIFTFSLTLGDFIIPTADRAPRACSSAPWSTCSRAPSATSPWPPPSPWCPSC